MKSNIARRAVDLVALALAIATFTPSAFAQCSFTRAAGTYGVSDSGAVVGIGPRAAVGTLTLDAAEKNLTQFCSELRARNSARK